MRRRVSPLSNPINPIAGGKAHSKDPRNFTSGNVPGEQWDEMQFAADRSELYDSGKPLPHIADVTTRHIQETDGVVRAVPTRTRFVRWQRGTGSDVIQPLVPVLLVPLNPARLSIQFGPTQYNSAAGAPQFDNTLFFSWGRPPVLGIVPLPIGNFVLQGGMVQFSGETCPIDELWVWNITLTGAFYCAFEGTAAPEGNQ